MNNNQLPNANERKQIMDTLTGLIKFGGQIEIDDDDSDGHFTITQTWDWNGESNVRVLHCQLTVDKIFN
jgi:hypothetical protein